MHLFQNIFDLICSLNWLISSYFFQVDPENGLSHKQNPASYTQSLTAASRGLHRYYGEYYVQIVVFCLLKPIKFSLHLLHNTDLDFQDSF